MNENQGQSRLLFWSILGAIVIVILWTATGFAVWAIFDSPEKRGTFGDMFGSINALFSGWAFLGVIIAILLQKMELEEQRKEIRDSRIAHQQTADELRQQTFDNAFFQMVSLHHQLVEAIVTYRTNGTPMRGRDCLGNFYRVLKSNLSQEHKINEKSVMEKYEKLHSDIEGQVGHYFRNLYNIIKFVDRNAVKDKKLYTNLVRAQLSSSELLLLFYNGISENGREKFKPLIEKYALLKNMPIEKLIHESHRGWYDDSAFQSSQITR